MSALKWHTVNGGYRAWAPELYPRDPFPPAYVLVKVNETPRRVIKMLRGELGHREAEHVGSAKNLAEAKDRAQRHYERRGKSSVDNLSA